MTEILCYWNYLPRLLWIFMAEYSAENTHTHTHTRKIVLVKNKGIRYVGTGSKQTDP